MIKGEATHFSQAVMAAPQSKSNLEVAVRRIPTYIRHLKGHHAKLTDTAFLAHKLLHACLKDSVTLKNHFNIFWKTDIYQSAEKKFQSKSQFHILQPEILQCCIYLYLQQQRLCREHPLLVNNRAIQLLLETLDEIMKS